MSWQQDLQAAAAHQALVASLFLTAHPTWEVVEAQGYDKDKDLEFWDDRGGVVPVYAVECKNDVRCYETDNLAVETACNGRWSGVRTTLADVVVYTSHLYSPKAALQGQVRCAAVTWAMAPAALWQAARAALEARKAYEVETTRDPRNVATCTIVPDVVAFVKAQRARGLLQVLDTRACPWPALHKGAA